MSHIISNSKEAQIPSSTFFTVGPIVSK